MVSCNFSKAIQENHERLDHMGQEVTFSYEEFESNVMIHSNGTIKDGFMPRISETIARLLNLTPTYVRVGTYVNESVTEDMQNIAEGKIQGSIWGYIPTVEREELVTFSQPLGKTKLGFGIRSPKTDDVSFINYVAEFKPKAWRAILGSIIAFWIMFWFISFHGQSRRQSLKDSFVSTLTTMLRTCLIKVPKYVFNSQ